MADVTRTEAVIFTTLVRSVATAIREAYNQAVYAVELWEADGGGRNSIAQREQQYREAADRLLRAQGLCDDGWAEYLIQRAFVEIQGPQAQTVAGSADINLSLDNPDLSEVEAGNSIWIDFDPNGAGEQFFTIQAVNDVSKVVTVNGTQPSVTGTFEWAIGTQSLSFADFFNSRDPNDRIIDGSENQPSDRPGPIIVQDILNNMTYATEQENWFRRETFSATAPGNAKGDGGSYAFENQVRATRSQDPTIMTVAEAQNLINRCTDYRAEYQGFKLSQIDRMAVQPRGAQ